VYQKAVPAQDNQSSWPSIFLLHGGYYFPPWPPVKNYQTWINTGTATKCNTLRPSPSLFAASFIERCYWTILIKFSKSGHQPQGGPDTGLVFKWLAFRLAVLTLKNARLFNYSVIFVQYKGLFMNRSVGELYIVNTLNCFRNVWDLVKFDKYFWKCALL